MFTVSSNNPQGLAAAAAAPSPRPDAVARPGWPEIIVGLVAFLAIAIGGVLLAGQLALDPVVYGLALAALSVIAPFAGFAAAVLLRIRSLSAFGVRRVSWRWLLIGAGAGVVAFVVRGFAVEELLFRGVLTNALLRYGPFIGVVGSTLIFALAHGINVVFPVGLVFGLIVGEVFRRSGSVWPGVIAHVINNLPTVFVLVRLRTT